MNDDLYIDFSQLTADERASVARELRSLGRDKVGEEVYAVLDAIAGEPESPEMNQEQEVVMADEIQDEVVVVEENPETEELEQASDEPTEDYAEVITKLQGELESFRERVNAAEAAQKSAEERFAEEQRLRRLSEFTDKAKTFSFGWEIETFAQDAMAVADSDPELWERWETRLRAVNEQIRQSGVFEQYSVAGGEGDERPAFIRKVEEIQKERYSKLAKAEGFAEAFKDAEREYPDLARKMAMEED